MLSPIPIEEVIYDKNDENRKQAGAELCQAQFKLGWLAS